MQNDNVKLKDEEVKEDWKAKAEEYLNNWKRERADFVNYKKEEGKRLEEFVKFANLGLLLEVIEVLDDLEAAAKHSGDEGSRQILKKFQDLLGKQGIERIKTDGKFDPSEQEAVEGSSELGHIEEVRAGYKMNGRVIRPARVKLLNKTN